ncbi:MAG: hypothetical protein R3C59_25740 [Planctomycetaceae bacterium]
MVSLFSLLNSGWVHVVIAVCSLFTIPAAALGQGSRQQADERFLRQLTERRFFGMAEQHCRHQQQLATDAAGRAIWQLRLCQTYRQHAWFEESTNRSGLLNQSMELLAEFLTDTVPPPEVEFLLRLEQAATLAHSLRMNLIVSEAGHLFGDRRDRPETALNTDSQAVLERAIEVTDALQKQLESIRRDLDPVDVREIRDACRVMMAELLCLKVRLAVAGSFTPASRNALTDSAEAAVQTALRTVTDDLGKHKCQWLLAELALVTGTSDQFRLRLRAIRETTAVHDLEVAEFLEIRHLLRQQEATAALTLATETKGQTALQIQQLDWLTLEAMAGVRELLGELDEPQQLAAADADFQRQVIRTQQTAVGVFLEAARRTQQRASLVGEVGAEVADLIEQVDDKRRRGETSTAQSLIDLALNRLTASGSKRAIAALSLRSGEILVEQQNWNEAANRLTRASTLFDDLNMTSQLAVADLLNIFVLAQRWSSATNNSDHADNAVTKADYVSALQNHLKRFPDQPTAERARDWLLRVVQADDPASAARLLLDAAQRESNPAARIATLEQVGQLLTALPESRKNAAEEQIREFQRVVQSLTDSSAVDAQDLSVLQVLDLDLEISRTAVESNRWSALDERLQELSQAFASIDATGDSSSAEWAKHRLAILEALTAARLAADSKRLTTLKNRLLQLPLDRQQMALNFLSERYSDSTDSFGNIWLATTCESLAQRQLDSFLNSASATPEAVVLSLSLFPAIVKAANVSGRFELQRQVLERLLNSELTPEQLDQVAGVIAEGSGQDGVVGEIRQREVLKQFWTQILERHDQGSDLWLEATLQLSELAFSTGDTKEARRRLLPVEALYPDWGQPARQQRATDLKGRLSP